MALRNLALFAAVAASHARSVEQQAQAALFEGSAAPAEPVEIVFLVTGGDKARVDNARHVARHLVRPGEAPIKFHLVSDKAWAGVDDAVKTQLIAVMCVVLAAWGILDFVPALITNAFALELGKYVMWSLQIPIPSTLSRERRHGLVVIMSMATALGWVLDTLFGGIATSPSP